MSGLGDPRLEEEKEWNFTLDMLLKNIIVELKRKFAQEAKYKNKYLFRYRCLYIL